MLNQYPRATRPLRLVYRHRPPPHSRSPLPSPPNHHIIPTSSTSFPQNHHAITTSITPFPTATTPSPQATTHPYIHHAIPQNQHVITTKPARHHHKTSTSSPQNQHVITTKPARHSREGGNPVILPTHTHRNTPTATNQGEPSESVLSPALRATMEYGQSAGRLAIFRMGCTTLRCP